MRIQASISRALCISALVFYSSMLPAEMYKWVDEDGNTHYTQSPPPGGIQGETIKPPPRINPEHANKQLENRKKLLNNLQSERNKSKQAEMKKKQEEEQKKANCEQARAHFASMERPRVNQIAEDGTRTVMPEEQRLADLKAAREKVQEYCN